MGHFPLLHTKIGLYSKGSKGQSVGEVNITTKGQETTVPCLRRFMFRNTMVRSRRAFDINVCLSGLYLGALQAPRRRKAAPF